jgi:hypothetical protein
VRRIIGTVANVEAMVQDFGVAVLLAHVYEGGGGGDRNRQGSTVQHKRGMSCSVGKRTFYEHLTDEEWKEYTM